jgi:hypothetical protein
LEQIKRFPEVTRELIANINARLLHMEHLSLEQAAQHLTAKKGRMAKGTSAFPHSSGTKRRGRPQSVDLAESGIGPYLPVNFPTDISVRYYTVS